MTNAWRQQILTKSCQDGDMTRAGVHNAFLAASAITTDNLVASDLNFSQAGSPPSRATYIAQADPSQEGGLRQVQDTFTAPEAQSYVAPHQKQG